MAQQDSIATVRTLICHRDVDTGIACLRSLVRFSLEPLRLVVHEDGSLTESDVARLSSELPGLRMVYRRHADDLLNDLLKHHRRCYEYRYQQPFALKLLDVPLLSDEDIAFTDTDVLFLRPFRGLFRWPDEVTAAVFMADCREAYSVRPWHLVGRNKVRLPSRVNVGMFLLRKRAHDLDFLEWCLGRAEFQQVTNWIEQTCWAALGSHAGCRLWDERHIAVMRPGMPYAEKVAVHFVSGTRRLLRPAIERLDHTPPAADAAQVATVRPADCQPLALARSQARHECGILKYKVLSRLRLAS
jgi:hypothetical protein